MATNIAFQGGFGEGMRQRAEQGLKERQLGMDLMGRAQKLVGGIGSTISDLISNSPDRASIPKQHVSVLGKTAEELIAGVAKHDPGMAKAMSASLQAQIQSAKPMAEQAAAQAQSKVAGAQALVDAAAGASQEAQRVLGLLKPEEKDLIVQRGRAAGLSDEEITVALRRWVDSQGAERQGPNAYETIRRKIAAGEPLTPGEQRMEEAAVRGDPFAAFLSSIMREQGQSQASTPPAPQAQPVPATPTPQNPSPPVASPAPQSGAPMVFNTPEEVEAALQAGQVQVGDIVIVGGQRVRIDP